VDAVSELVEELSGKPALVAYEFDHERERLQERFPNAPYIGGGVPANRFREIEIAWNKGEIPVLLAQPQSVAHGLNLMGTSAHVIWYTVTWNLELYEQLIRRVWRQGQKETVIVHHITARKTVDEVVLKCLNKKDQTQSRLLDALKSYTESRPRTV
jgi:SNF2 family DNA or RNA helicase